MDRIPRALPAAKPAAGSSLFDEKESNSTFNLPSLPPSLFDDGVQDSFLPAQQAPPPVAAIAVAAPSVAASSTSPSHLNINTGSGAGVGAVISPRYAVASAVVIKKETTVVAAGSDPLHPLAALPLPQPSASPRVPAPGPELSPVASGRLAAIGYVSVDNGDLVLCLRVVAAGEH